MNEATEGIVAQAEIMTRALGWYEAEQDRLRSLEHEDVPLESAFETLYRRWSQDAEQVGSLAKTLPEQERDSLKGIERWERFQDSVERCESILYAIEMNGR